MSPHDRVLAFCTAWSGRDIEAVISSLSSDIEYHNIPMEPLSGIHAVEPYLRTAMDLFESCRLEILHIAANGEFVLTERMDRMVHQGRVITLPNMGIFRVRDDRICEWRDYFDLALYRAQFGSEN